MKTEISDKTGIPAVFSSGISTFLKFLETEEVLKSGMEPVSELESLQKTRKY
jgi:hypothetical protein